MTQNPGAEALAASSSDFQSEASDPSSNLQDIVQSQVHQILENFSDDTRINKSDTIHTLDLFQQSIQDPEQKDKLGQVIDALHAQDTPIQDIDQFITAIWQVPYITESSSSTAAPDGLI